MSKSGEGFYKDQVGLTLNTSFQAVSFTAKGHDFTSSTIFLANDHVTNYIEYSLDGTIVHGKLKAGEKREMYGRALSKLYLRGQVGSEEFRLEVY